MKAFGLILVLSIVHRIRAYICIPPFCTPNCQDEAARCDNGPEYCIDGSPDCWDEITTTTIFNTYISTLWETQTTTMVLATTLISTQEQLSVATTNEIETQTTTVSGDVVTSTETVTVTEGARARLERRSNIKVVTELDGVYGTYYSTQWDTDVLTSFDYIAVTSWKCCSAYTLKSTVIETTTVAGSTVVVSETTTVQAASKDSASTPTSSGTGAASGTPASVASSGSTASGSGTGAASASSTGAANSVRELDGLGLVAGLVLAVLPGALV